VGETGCGKTVTALSTLRLIPNPGKIERGDIFLKTDEGLVNLMEKDEKYMEKIRGRYISIVFQEPGAALDPIYKIGEQIGEALLIHRKNHYYSEVLKSIEEKLKVEKSPLRRFILKLELKICRELIKDPNSAYSILLSFPFLNEVNKLVENLIKNDAIFLLRAMGIPDPERTYNRYPHELSGGMKQRAVIAMALACNPKILIADEPTTNLDVTIEAQILHLIRELRDRFNSSILYITHDFGIVAEICDRVAVMYAGNICEIAGVEEIFRKPLHPYTKALIESIPRPGKPFKSIPGTIPNLINPPSGCRFHPRCPHAMEICSKETPKVKEIERDHLVACHLYR
jgi:peptide/nickel transport system ATP-binding protein